MITSYRSLWFIVGIICPVYFGSIAAHADNVARLEIVQRVSVSLADAIETVLGSFPGYAVAGRLKEEDGMFYYEVGLVSDATQVEVYIHPANGLIIGSESKRFNALRLQRRWKARLNVVSHSALTVTDVMKIAYQRASGRILEIDLKKRRGEYIYRVVICEGRTEHNIDINAYSGEVVGHEILII